MLAPLRFGVFLLLVMSQLSEATGFADLQRYAGTWTITRKSGGTNISGNKEQLKNQCVTAGTFFVCQQSNGGAVTGLLVFAPAAQSGQFHTQTVLPDGRATGKGELTITDGKKWVFLSNWNGGSAVTRYRTTNTFVTPNQIQFTQEESTDGTHWQLKDSGEEVRVSR